MNKQKSSASSTSTKANLVIKIPHRFLVIVIIFLVSITLIAHFGSIGLGNRSQPQPQPREPAVVQIEIQQTDLTFKASLKPKPLNLKIDWRYRIIEAQQKCDSSTFDLQPNHPSIQAGNQLVIPQSTKLQDAFYRNRLVCFQALILDQLAYPAYASKQIDLGNPIITVLPDDNPPYLRVRANKPVVYHLLNITHLNNSDASPYAGSLCQRQIIPNETPSLVFDNNDLINTEVVSTLWTRF